jgi:hypothetical protein
MIAACVLVFVTLSAHHRFWRSHGALLNGVSAGLVILGVLEICLSIAVIRNRSNGAKTKPGSVH